MDRKKLILLVGALIIALGAAFMARSLYMGAPAPEAAAEAPPPPPPAGPKILVANRALPVGTIITVDSVSYQMWPQELLRENYFVEGEVEHDKIVGTVVRSTITAGEPITQGAIVHSDDRGFLAAALGPGMRAVTIPISARNGVAGFVFPGDRVDLMLTQKVKAEDGPELKTTETIIRNLRILATDQNPFVETNGNGTTRVRTFKSITVEATPRIAEKLAVAQTLGTLSLSLRSIADNQSELERAIASGDVTLPKGMTAAEEEKFLRAAVTRPVDAGSSYVTGGDVSRFHRRTLPAAQAPAVPAATPDSVVLPPPAPSVTISRGNNVSAVTVSR